MSPASETYIVNMSGGGDFYEKFCLCGLDYNEDISETVIEYDPSLSGSALYANTNVYKNGREEHCPITSCKLLASDCTSALTAPMSTYVSADDDDAAVPPGPWAVRINVITQPGYVFDNVCYQCTNGE